MLETLQDASSSGLSMQKASKSEMDPMVQKQLSARPKLSGDVRETSRKLRLIRVVLSALCN